MALLRAEGWRVNHKRVERLWRREGLRVPAKPPRRRRLWLADGTITRRRATRPNHVWSYDFVPDRTHDGRSRRLLCVVDEYTRACLAIVVAPRLRADDVLACRTQLFVAHGPPTSLRSDNGPEFTAHAVRSWLLRVGVTTLFIQPVSPWENGSGESFNSKLRDECLNGEIFTTLAEAKVLIARWRREYNEQRPHSALGYPQFADDLLGRVPLACHADSLRTGPNPRTGSGPVLGGQVSAPRKRLRRTPIR